MAKTKGATHQPVLAQDRVAAFLKLSPEQKYAELHSLALDTLVLVMGSANRSEAARAAGLALKVRAPRANPTRDRVNDKASKFASLADKLAV